MTYDIIMSGTRGFIGRSLLPALQAAGFTVISLDDWRALPTTKRPRAQSFLHLANIHGNPMANVALLRHTLAEVGPMVQRWVQFQSAITLVGCGEADAAKTNFGITPTCLDAYATGKLLQELELIQAKIPTLFCYLPLVMGDGGPWDAVKTQAAQHGYSLPADLPHHTYPQVLSLETLAQELIALLKHPPAPGCTRRLVADTTQPTSWFVWLGPKQLPAPTLFFRQRLRRLAAAGRDFVLAAAYGFGLLAPLARLLYGPVPTTLPPRQSTPAPRVPAGPWHPHGIMAHHLRLAPQVTPQDNAA